jgi:hypothetical protein
MDYYSYDGGKWSNYFRENEERKNRLLAKKKNNPTNAPAAVKIQYEE